MAKEAFIFGKDTSPCTTKPREDFASTHKVLYLNAGKEPEGLRPIPKHSRGKRWVPVIVDGSKVTSGWDAPQAARSVWRSAAPTVRAQIEDI